MEHCEASQNEVRGKLPNYILNPGGSETPGFLIVIDAGAFMY